jgi:hypothetical protein
MSRFPTHILEHLDLSGADPVRPSRSLCVADAPLEEALTPRRRAGAITNLHRFAGVPRIGTLSVAVTTGTSVPRPTHVPPLNTPRRFPVASIDLSRREVGLPYGVPRFVNAATLKAIAGGRPFDRLLKKTRAGWEFVPNDTRIDLTDASQEFRLGRLTIFS